MSNRAICYLAKINETMSICNLNNKKILNKTIMIQVMSQLSSVNIVFFYIKQSQKNI